MIYARMKPKAFFDPITKKEMCTEAGPLMDVLGFVGSEGGPIRAVCLTEIGAAIGYPLHDLVFEREALMMPPMPQDFNMRPGAMPPHQKGDKKNGQRK
jgi:hypothetical protein